MGMKKMGEDKWVDIDKSYKEGKKMNGRVKKMKE